MAVQVLWTGRKNLEKVNWEHDPSKKFSFSQDFVERKNHLWQQMTTDYPQIYDGTIIVLEKYQEKEDQVTFNTRSIKFSEMVMLERNSLPMPESLGPLGFQAIILNQPENHFLIGKRSEKSEYRPGFLTIPGGLFELEDIGGSVKSACLRELNEEMELSFDESEMFLVAILQDYSLGINLLLECQILDEWNSNALFVKGNEEWEKKLRWITFDQALNLDEKTIMEGLSFIKNHRT